MFRSCLQSDIFQTMDPFFPQMTLYSFINGKIREWWQAGVQDPEPHPLSLPSPTPMSAPQPHPTWKHTKNLFRTLQFCRAQCENLLLNNISLT